MPMAKLVDHTEVRKAWVLTFEPDQVVEVRVMDGTTRDNRYPSTLYGFFNDVEKAIEGLSKLTSFSNVYCPLHPTNPRLLARAANRLKRAEKGRPGCSTASDITQRRWLLVDCDPIRPAGISSSDVEHQAALTRATEIRDYLIKEGCPTPILADSGNGAHLLCPHPAPVEDEGYTRQFLASLAAEFNDSLVSIDQSVFDPPRLRKLYGTLACKGDSTADAPHRMSRILEAA